MELPTSDHSTYEWIKYLYLVCGKGNRSRQLQESYGMCQEWVLYKEELQFFTLQNFTHSVSVLHSFFWHLKGGHPVIQSWALAIDCRDNVTTLFKAKNKNNVKILKKKWNHDPQFAIQKSKGADSQALRICENAFTWRHWYLRTFASSTKSIRN